MTVKELLDTYSEELDLSFPFENVEALIESNKRQRELIKKFMDDERTEREEFKENWKRIIEDKIRQDILIELRTMTIGELADKIYT